MTLFSAERHRVPANAAHVWQELSVAWLYGKAGHAGALSRPLHGGVASSSSRAEHRMIAIELTAAPTEEVRVLVDELEALLGLEYPPERRHGLPLEAIFRPEIRFFLAKMDGIAVGCGGVAFFAGFAEVKRMYVRAAGRGQGVAQALLARIEAETRVAGLAVLRLETGTAQRAAMRLYEKAGFRRREAFGPYADMPPENIAGSVFFEKCLEAEKQPPSA